jgi:hypothetical protein
VTVMLPAVGDKVIYRDPWSGVGQDHRCVVTNTDVFNGRDIVQIKVRKRYQPRFWVIPSLIRPDPQT